jgi:hypothetical protein
MMKLLPYTIAWAILALVVAILAVRRRLIASEEDDVVRLSEPEAGAVEHQLEVAKRLEAIDKWGKPLTIVLAVAGVILAVFYGLAVFEASSTSGM